MARQRFVGARAPPAALQGALAARGGAQTQQRTAATRAPGEAFGVDRRAGTVERERSTEQVGDVRQTPPCTPLPVHLAQALAGHQRELTAHFILLPDAG